MQYVNFPGELNAIREGFYDRKTERNTEVCRPLLLQPAYARLLKGLLIGYALSASFADFLLTWALRRHVKETSPSEVLRDSDHRAVHPQCCAFFGKHAIGWMSPTNRELWAKLWRIS